MTRSTITPMLANQAIALRQKRSSDGLFVVEDLGVHDPGSVIDRGVDEPVPRR
jgi:hypothetical protein